MLIRPATIDDLPAILDIYNDEVLNGVATFDTQPRTLGQQTQWFAAHDSRHPILVAVLDGRVAGWASLNQYSDRAAYDGLAEDSLYIHRDFRRRGAGKALLAALLDEGRRVGLHSVLARITEGNDVSIRLHQDNDFAIMGVLREAGEKFGRLLDVVFMQKIYR